MKLYFNADFSTDGDFGFYEDRVKQFFNADSSFYKGANITYSYNHDGEDISVFLKAEGDANACRYACRDLLEALMCSIRTCKHWLVKDLYELLEYFHKDLWGELNQEKENELSGNYDGTYVTLSMKE